jgi:transposase-like protein
MTTTNGTAPPATTAAGDKLDWLLGDITGGHPTSRPNPEVAARAKRRRFTAEYKEKVLAQADAARGSGEIGALLRREGLYSSLLATWRREREAAIRKGLSPQKRGPKPQTSPEALENQKLQRENERLTEHLRKAQMVIDIQKKWLLCWARRCRKRRRCNGRTRRTDPGGGRETGLRRAQYPAGFLLQKEDPGGFARLARGPAAGSGALAGSGGTGEGVGAPA